MGSWANSLHVKADDPKKVVAEIQNLLLARGYKLAAAPAKSRVGEGWTPRYVEEITAQYEGDPKDTGPKQSGPNQSGGTATADGFASNGDKSNTGRFGAKGFGKPGGGKQRFDGDFGESDFDDEFDEDFDNQDDDFDLGGYDDDDDIDEGDFGGFGGDEDEGRAVCIFQPNNGWVGVLDSSLEGNIELASQLSARLHTDTMLVMVNDSDSWYYWFHRNGQSFDEFDSAGGALDDDGEISGEWLEAMENEDEEKLHELLMSKAPQNIKFPDPSIGLPFQLAVLGAKIQAGQATFWERLKYRWLTIKFLWKLLTGKFSEAAMGYGYDVPHNPPDEDALRRHIERIQAFFPKAGEAELRELLPQCRFPSEDLLRKFLTIVELPWLYAYLSYTYLEEHSERELASHGIVHVTELRFDPPGKAA
jgi:hypothetical protein